MLTAMEYLREEAVEKEEGIETAMSRIGAISLGESSDKTETSTQDVEDVEEIEPIDAWPEQGRNVSWVDRIKTIGKNAIFQLYYTTWHIVGWHTSLI